MRVIWAPLAEEQVADAFAYIAAERPAAALKWFEAVVSATESLSALPDQGRMVPEADRPSLREVLVQPYRVVYQHRGRLPADDPRYTRIRAGHLIVTRTMPAALIAAAPAVVALDVINAPRYYRWHDHLVP